MQFKDLVGQDHVIQHLIEAVLSQRISHAQLFISDKNCGQLELALAYCQFIACTNKQEHDSCGNCSNCHKFNKGIHPDLHFILPLAKSKKSKAKDSQKPITEYYLEAWNAYLKTSPIATLDNWGKYLEIENRQLLINVEEVQHLQSGLNYAPSESEYRFFILWHPEKMNTMAANKLLKVLEEPPEKTLFILVGQETKQLLPTILSRVQKVQLQTLELKDLQEFVHHHYPNSRLEHQQASFLESCDHDLGRLCSLIEHFDSFESSKNLLQTWLRACYSLNIADLAQMSESFVQLGREQQKVFLNFGCSMVDHFFSSNYLNLDHFDTSTSAFTQKFKPFTNPNNIAPIYQALNTAIYQIERNGNAKLVFMSLSLKMNGLLHLK